MNKRYFLSLRAVVCFLFVSLFFQSCGGSGNLPLEAGEEPTETTEKDKQGRRKRTRIEIGSAQGDIQSLVGQAQEISSFDIFPSEIWQSIFSYLNFEKVLAARLVNADWNELITGYRQAGIVGVENKPCYIIDTRGWTSKSEINFRSNKLRQIKLETIPSFAFYHLMGEVRSLPREFWPYLQKTNIYRVVLLCDRIGLQGATLLAKHLQGTHVHTVDLNGNGIGAQGAGVFVKHLQGTHVHTVDLSWNCIGAQGAVEFAKHLQGTQVHTVDLIGNQIGAQGAKGFAKHLQETKVLTVNLSWNGIGAQGAIEFAKHLQGTSVHTVKLWVNGIGDQGAERFAKHLQGTSVHTANLQGNDIGAAMQQLLKEEYPHINWIF